jgi:hypothetical protein
VPVERDDGTQWHFTYEHGKRFPWFGEGAGMAAELRYDPATGSAVGVRHGPVHCRWYVRLVPIG